MDFKSFDLEEFERATGSKRNQLASGLDKRCKESGFVLLSGHGVDKEIIAAQWKAVSNFFSQSEQVKAQVSVPYPGYPYGWIEPNKESLAASKGTKTPPDLKESFNGGPLHIPLGILDKQAYEFCYQPTLFPDLEGFKEAWTSYYIEMERLAERIMGAFAEALGLERQYFEKFIQNPISALRALHYPPTLNTLETDQQRAGAHTDYGSLTILLPEKGSVGLQILLNGKWVDVPTIDNCFVVNIGDLMELWTSNRWTSTLHRVVSKPNQPQRKSLAFFHQPDWDAEIKPIDEHSLSQPVRSGPYLMSKFLSTSEK
ncbi:MAG: 2OG-Fe(II) oxygenase family protein [Pseudomonadota bacterium]|nr:2OG-Fe(II) oxygenase family protein [Pseudomonadota bacterium]